MVKKLAISAVIGALLGVIGSRILFVGSAMSLIPWGLVGVAIGYALAGSIRQALGLGAVYGFALAFVFMVAGYSGADPVVTKFGFFAVLGLAGAVCGLVAALVGRGLKAMMGHGY